MVVTGENISGFISNAEIFTNSSSYDNIASVLDTTAANVLKVQSYAMHIGEPAPRYYEDITIEELESAGAFEKNARIYELISERLTAALAASLYESSFTEYASLLTEKAAAAQRVLDAALAYESAVFGDLATYATEAMWHEACDAAAAELDAAIAELNALSPLQILV